MYYWMYTKAVFAVAWYFCIVGDPQETLLTLVAKFNFKLNITGLSDSGDYALGTCRRWMFPLSVGRVTFSCVLHGVLNVKEIWIVSNMRQCNQSGNLGCSASSNPALILPVRYKAQFVLWVLHHDIMYNDKRKLYLVVFRLLCFHLSVGFFFFVSKNTSNLMVVSDSCSKALIIKHADKNEYWLFFKLRNKFLMLTAAF